MERHNGLPDRIDVSGACGARTEILPVACHALQREDQTMLRDYHRAIVEQAGVSLNGAMQTPISKKPQN